MYQLLRSLKIQHRILILVMLGIVGSFVLLVVAAFHTKQLYISMEKENTRSNVESAIQIAQYYHGLSESGVLTTVQAKMLALGVLRNLERDKFYVYIYHDLNFMVMHPYLPEQSLSDLTLEDQVRSKEIGDAQSEQHRVKYNLDELRRTPLEILRRHNPVTKTGFFDYFYIVDVDGLGFIAELDDPHVPSGSPPKMGYGSYFEPWEWTILAGVYFEDLDAAVMSTVSKLVGMLLVVVCVLGLCSWGVSRSISQPLKEGLDRVNKIIVAKKFKMPEGNKGDGFQRMQIAFSSLVEQLEGQEVNIRAKSMQLENSNKELEDHKASLEKTIEDRTSDFKIAKEQAEEATKAKSQFLATMTHELRTPMSGVIGIVDLLRETSLSKTQQEYVNIISASGNQLLDIISDILDFEKLSANKFELEKINVDIRKLVEELVMPFQLRIRDNDKLKFVIDIPKDFPDYIVGDPVRIKQVINNFLSNAFKFTKEGEITTRVRRTTNNESEYLSIGVSDTGVGLTEDQQKTLFSEYQQADKSVSRKYGGTGLGLSISKKLVDLMGGEVSLSSEAGKGSTFGFDFPLVVAKETKIIPSKGSEQEKNGTGFGELKVLVAEDNSVNQMVIKGYLRRLNITPILVENGQLAIEQIESNNFNLVLMDINMPILDGVEACRIVRERELKDHQSPTVIYALTGDTMQQSTENYEAVGMNGTLPKPIDFQSLVTTLSGVLATSANTTAQLSQDSKS